MQTIGMVFVAVASDAAGNVRVHRALSSWPPSPGAVLHQVAHASCLQVEHTVVAAGAAWRHLALVSSEELDGGRTGTPIRGRRQVGRPGGVANRRSWPAEPRGVQVGLTLHRPSPRSKPAASSRGPCTSADPLIS